MDRGANAAERRGASAPLSTEVSQSVEWAGLLAPGSCYSPRLPGYYQWHNAAFIACYSCGTARDSHPFPYYP